MTSIWKLGALNISFCVAASAPFSPIVIMTLGQP